MSRQTGRHRRHSNMNFNTFICVSTVSTRISRSASATIHSTNEVRSKDWTLLSIYSRLSSPGSGRVLHTSLWPSNTLQLLLEGSRGVPRPHGICNPSSGFWFCPRVLLPGGRGQKTSQSDGRTTSARYFKREAAAAPLFDQELDMPRESSTNQNLFLSERFLLTHRKMFWSSITVLNVSSSLF